MSSAAKGYSDSDYWRALRAGDSSALAALSNRYYRDLYHYSTKFTADQSLIEDVLQDLFLSIWEKRAVQPAVDSVKAYLFTAIRHNLLHQIHRAQRTSPLADQTDMEEGECNPEYEFIRTETSQYQQYRLTEALDQLPRRQREAIYLKYYEDLSYEEIARVMGLSRQVVANYLHQALLTLRATCRYFITFFVLTWLAYR